jgi:hypothetical protein
MANVVLITIKNTKSSDLNAFGRRLNLFRFSCIAAPLNSLLTKELYMKTMDDCGRKYHTDKKDIK